MKQEIINSFKEDVFNDINFRILLFLTGYTLWNWIAIPHNSSFIPELLKSIIPFYIGWATGRTMMTIIVQLILYIKKLVLQIYA